jgi:hypothetical protein
MAADAPLLGRGMAFPPRLDADGRVAWAAGHRSVQDSIRIILTTEPGERLMLPTFGAGLRSFLFEPNVPATHRLIEERVQHALRRWEPRINLSSVVARSRRDDPSRATVTISYTLVATGAREDLELSVDLSGGGGAR